MDLRDSGVSTNVKGVDSNEDILAGGAGESRLAGSSLAYGAGFG